MFGAAQMSFKQMIPPVGGYARWFDASSTANVSLTGTTVNQWNDLSTNHAHATPQSDAYDHKPDYVSNAINGMGAIHFLGGTGVVDSNNKNLLFSADASIRTTFSIFKGASFLLTSSASYYDFHRYGAGDADPTEPLWNSANGWTSTNIRNGTTRVNGAAVDGTSYNMPTASNEGFNLVTVLTTGNVRANGFNRDRTFHSGDQYQAEVIIYDVALTNSEVLKVEGYLNTKWGLGI